MTLMQRRDFLKGLGFLSASAALSQLGSLQAQASDASGYKALVCVFLFGGNDGNNMIVPLDARHEAYTSLRGAIALPKSALTDMTDANGALEFGMHSALNPLKAAWSAGHLAAVLNTGPLLRPATREQLLAGISRPAGLFSHSDQQRTWQMAGASESRGWGGRLVDELASANAGSRVPGAIALAQEAAFTHAHSGTLVLPTSGGLVLRGSGSSPAARARAAALERMLVVDKNFELVAAAQAITGDVLARREAVNGIVNANSTAITNAFKGQSSTLSKQLATIAKVIERHRELGVKRQVFFVGAGGFDTHSGQLDTQRYLLAQLAGALKAFYDATVAIGAAHQVTTFTLSDFARTMRANTVGGTDHAWGNHHWVLGGAVQGRRLYGQYPQLIAGGPDDLGNEGRWIPTTSLDQYVATLAQWFGVDERRLDRVLPQLANFETRTLGFL